MIRLTVPQLVDCLHFMYMVFDDDLLFDQDFDLAIYELVVRQVSPSQRRNRTSGP